jgi:uncharacterized protein YbcI
LTIEESIRHIYHRVELETIGTASNELHVLAADNKIVIIARGAIAGAHQTMYRQALQTEFASELGVPSVTLRTGVSLADDEKMEIFMLSQ